MGIIIAVLRFVIPLIVIILIARIMWPRYKKYKQHNASRIEVEAEVVNSEQPEPQYPKSTTYTSSDTEE